MTPMEAWTIISANLTNYYKLIKNNTSEGYTENDIKAEIICFKALKDMEEKGKD